MGPVQVLVLGFARPAFTGEVLAELTRLREAGIVRLVDVLLVSRDDAGAFETLAGPPGMPAGLGDVTAALLGQADEDGRAQTGTGPGDDVVPLQSGWSLADCVPPGTTAAVALIEHIWATPLRDVLQRSGGTPLDETWLSPADHELLEALIDRGET